MAQDEFMNRYFPNETEYPQVSGSAPILELGTLWSYISGDFLNGFLNYPTIISGMLVSRYRKPDENLTALAKFQKASDDDLQHTDLGKWFRDDIHLLGREGLGRDYNYKKHPITYWYFWYDQDVSDCSIGRFVSSDGVEQITELFKQQCRYYLQIQNEISDSNGAMEIPVQRLRGWNKF